MIANRTRRVRFSVEMDLRDGQDAEGWSDSILMAVETIDPANGEVVGGVGIEPVCAGGRHPPRAEKHATFTYCGECGNVDLDSGP